VEANGSVVVTGGQVDERVIERRHTASVSWLEWPTSEWQVLNSGEFSYQATGWDGAEACPTRRDFADLRREEVAPKA
jgi:hypothetical protein